MGQICYPSKSWVFKSRFSFNVRKHGQQKVYLQYKPCWILYKMATAPSFSQPYFCIQPSLQPPLKICSSTSDKFYLPIQPLRFCKINLAIHTKTLFLYTSATFHFPAIYTKRFFSNWTTKPMHTAPTDQVAGESCEDQHCFNLSLLLLVVASDEGVCNWKGKPPNSPSLIPSTICHYFHTLLIPSQKLILH